MSSVVKRKRSSPTKEEIAVQERIMYRVLKTLSKELGLSLSAIYSAVQAYNYFLWQWLLKPALLQPVIETGKAIKTISVAGKDAILNIANDMKDYIFYHPIEITACASNLYMSDEEEPFKNQLKQIANDLGEQALKELGMEAQKITINIMSNVVTPAIEKYLLPLSNPIKHPKITGSTVPLLANVPFQGLDTDFEIKDLAIPIEGDISIDKAQGKLVQFMEAEEELKVVPSSIEILTTHTGCKIMDWAGKKMNLKIPSKCIDTLRIQPSVNSLEKNCPRVYQDMQKTIHRQIQDFSYKSHKAIERGITDVQIGMSRSVHDIMVSAQFFLLFFVIFVAFYSTFRVVFNRLLKLVRK